MKLVIDRLRWLRGTKNDSSLLQTTSGKMCCLGFYCLALGIPKESIAGVGMPSEIEVGEVFPALIKAKLVAIEEATDGEGPSKDDTWTCSQLAHFNDMLPKDISEDGREDNIIREFHSIGVEVEFVN